MRDHSAGKTGRKQSGRNKTAAVVKTSAKTTKSAKASVAAKKGKVRKIPAVAEDVTALKVSELWLDNIFNSLDEAVLVVTPDRRLVKVNKAAERMFGYSYEELEEHSTSILHVDQRHFEEFGRKIAAAFEKGKDAHFDFEAKRKNGEVFPTEHTVKLLKQGGSPVGIVSVVRDLTERKNAEMLIENKSRELAERVADLKGANKILERSIRQRTKIEKELVEAKKRAEENEERFRRSLEFSPIPIAVADSSGRHLLLNRQFTETYGYTIKDIPTIEQWIIKAYPDAGYRNSALKQWAEDVEAATRNNTSTPVREYSVTGKNGEVKTVEISAFFENDLSIGLFHDITKRKRAETELQETNELFSLFIHHSPIYTYIKEVTPAESRVVYASENFRDMVGISGSEMKGRTMMELFPAEFAAKITADDWTVVSGRKILRVDEDLNGRNYTTIKAPVVLSGKTLLAGYTIDITERRKIERVLELRLSLMEFSETHTVNELIRKALDEICEVTDSQIGFYHWVEKDQQALTLQEWSSRTLTEFCKAEGRGMHYSIDKAGVWVDCIRERRPVIHNDYASLPHRKGLPPGHAEVIRELVVPIFREGMIVAVLGVGNKPAYYDENDLNLVTYIADVIWGILERKQTIESVRERAKELNCLYEISRLLVEPKNTLDDICSSTVSIIPRSWQYEGITCARIIIDGKTFSTANFIETPWRQVSYIKVRGNTVGAVEVYYREEKEQRFEGPFLKEERALINGIAELLGIAYEQKRAIEKINLLLKAMETVEIGITIADSNGRITYTNPAEALMHGFDVEDLIGRHASILGPDKPKIPGVPPVAIEDMYHWKRETLNVSKDGRVFPVQLISTAVKDEFGRPIGIVTISEDITDRKRLEEQLKKLATTDSLTGCFNRRNFLELGTKEFNRSARYERPLSVLMLDIDYFKRINDTYGHAKGDETLIVLVGTCMSMLRTSDMLGRMGGEEFAIVLAETQLERATRLADRIRNKISEISIQTDGEPILFTVSIGVAEMKTDDGSFEDVINRADKALYKAKQSGRNRVETS